VRDVVVDGRIVLRAGRSTLVDEDALARRAHEAHERVVARAGLPHHHRWPTRRLDA
jgi:5-methylthioadenosine/S-adenosylhomocysteine deaminase